MKDLHSLWEFQCLSRKEAFHYRVESIQKLILFVYKMCNLMLHRYYLSKKLKKKYLNTFLCKGFQALMDYFPESHHFFFFEPSLQSLLEMKVTSPNLKTSKYLQNSIPQCFFKIANDYSRLPCNLVYN